MKSWISASLLGFPVGALWLLSAVFAVSLPLEAGAQQRDYFLKQFSSPQNSPEVMDDQGLDVHIPIIGEFEVSPAGADLQCQPDGEPVESFPVCPYVWNGLGLIQSLHYQGYYYRGSAQATGTCRNLYLAKGSFTDPGAWQGYLKEDDPCIPFFVDEVSRVGGGSPYQLDTSRSTGMMGYFPEYTSWSEVPHAEKFNAFRAGWAICRST